MIQHETFQFVNFIALGMIFSFLYDIFRAIRKTKKYSNMQIAIQDIIYFSIVGFLFIYTIYFSMQNCIRLYLFLAIILGILIYIGVVGNKIKNMLACLILRIRHIVSCIIKYILLPFELFLKFLIYFVEKCCKKFSSVLNYIYKYKRGVNIWQGKLFQTKWIRKILVKKDVRKLN